MNTDQAPPSDEIDTAIDHAVHRGHRMALRSAWARVVTCLVVSIAVLVGSLLARSAISDQRLEAGTGTAVDAAGLELSTSRIDDPTSSSIVDPILSTVTAVPRAPSAPVLVIDIDDPAKPSYVELSWTIPEESGPVDSFVVFRDEIAVHSGTQRSYRTTPDGTHQYMVRAIGPAATADSNIVTFPSQPTTPSISIDSGSPSTEPAISGPETDISSTETDKEQPSSGTTPTPPAVSVSEEPPAPSTPG